MGNDILGMEIGDTFYPSNELDPYLKDTNDNDFEEAEDMVVKPEDVDVVCAHVKDEHGRLLVCNSWRLRLVDGGCIVEMVLVALLWRGLSFQNGDGTVSCFVNTIIIVLSCLHNL
ncbi:hypothetical protein Hanom_Chr17g01542311 [Helianthus anomalus]